LKAGLIVGLCWLAIGACAHGQAIPLIKVPRPRLIVGDTMTVTCSPASMSFALVKGAATTGSTSIAVTTSWSGVSLLASMRLYAYFNSSSAALSGGSPIANIPSANIFGQMTTGVPVAYTPFTQSGAFGGAGASLGLLNLSSIVSLGGSRTDNLSLKIDLSTLPQLPAATYTGTLYLQAQAF
jgi:hypothetical protein